jgi:NAD-dependent SIR2 family protein deacetylase
MAQMEEAYQRVARLLISDKQCVALTGAGISAESGIPTFRSEGRDPAFSRYAGPGEGHTLLVADQ